MNETTTDIGNLIEPTPVGFSFDAPGWYAVGILLLMLVAGLMVWTWINHVRNRYRRDALRHILTLENEIKDKCMLVYEVNMLLKRIALRFMPRENLAPLRNEQWVDFLNRTGKAGLFSNGLINEVTLAIYAGTVTQENSDQFLTKAKEWIKTHKQHAELSRKPVN